MWGGIGEPGGDVTCRSFAEGRLGPQMQPQPLSVDLALVVRLCHHSGGEGHVTQSAALVPVHVAISAALQSHTEK